jgi:type I restriction enzyme R subunit
VLEEVELENYKVQKEYVAELILVSEPTAFYGIGAGAGNTNTPGEYDFLSNIIKTLNETYGLNLSSENKEDFEKIKKQIDANENLMSFFNPGNSRDNIRDKFYEELDDALLQFVNHKLELYNKLTEDKANATMKRLWFNELYDQRVRGISNM